MSWDFKKIGEICRIEKGKVGIQKAIPGEYPLVVTAEKRLSCNEFHFEGNAVIIPLVSSTGHGHKSLKRIHYQSGKFAVGNILCAVIPKDENILRADYLYRYLDLNRESELVARMKGMANVTLPMGEIAKITIPVPPIEVQIEFVQQFSILEKRSKDLNEELFSQLNLIKQLRHAFLREAMQGRLVPQDPTDEPASVLLEKIKREKEQLIREKKIKKEKSVTPVSKEEIPFEIPENWVWCRLGEIIYYSENLDIQKKLSPSTLMNYVDIDSIDNKNYKIREAKSKKMEELSSRARRILKKGYIIYSTVRPYLRNIAIVEEELPNMIGSTGFNVFIPIYSETKYLFYFLLSPHLNQEFEKLMVGFNSPSITNSQFENAIFPLPPFSEQHRIVSKLDELMSYCDNLEASIKASQQQNELLLQQVLREALEPKEAQLSEAPIVSLPVTNSKTARLFSAKEIKVRRKMLAAYLVNLSLDDKQFGKTKFEKLLHLTEYHILKHDYHQSYTVQAAGPYDGRFTNTFWNETLKSKWFALEEYGKFKRIVAGEQQERSTKDYGYYTEAEKTAIQSLVQLFRKDNYELPEIVSTLYAVWNNRIIRNERITDELLKQDFLNWDEGKARYTDRLDITLNWMRDKGIVPDGWGKVIGKAKN